MTVADDEELTFCDILCKLGYMNGFKRAPMPKGYLYHPAYIHGYRNGLIDGGHLMLTEAADDIRQRWRYIQAIFPDDEPEWEEWF